MDSGKEIGRIEGMDEAIIHLAISLDGTTLFALGVSGQESAFDLKTGKELDIEPEPNRYGPIFSKNRKWLATFMFNDIFLIDRTFSKNNSKELSFRKAKAFGSKDWHMKMALDANTFGDKFGEEFHLRRAGDQRTFD
ncbi:MAG: hypothetical protein R3C03_03965 [Pirellulaceae bacterium]